MSATSHQSTLGILAILGAAALWGTTGTIQTLLPPGKDPLVVAALRLLFGAATLFLLAGVSQESRKSFAQLPLASVVFAGVAIGIYNVLFFVAVLEVGVGIGTALAIGSAPLWVTLFDFVFRRAIPGRRRLIGQAVCIVGASLLVVSGSSSSASFLGLLLAILAGSAYATYSLVTSRMGGKIPSATIASSTFGVAALFLLPLILFFPTQWISSPTTWLQLLFLGAIATGVSYALYTWGLRYVAPSAAVTFALVEPLTAWLLATFVVGEELSGMKILGAVVLLLGLWVVTSTVRSGTASPESIK